MCLIPIYTVLSTKTRLLSFEQNKDRVFMLLINKVNINAQVQHFQCCAETLYILNYFIFNHAFVGWCVPMSASACRDKKRAPGPLELESQADVSCPRWILGTPLSSSIRAASAANHWATFPSLGANFNSSKCYFVLGVAGCMGVHSMKCGSRRTTFRS